MNKLTILAAILLLHMQAIAQNTSGSKGSIALGQQINALVSAHKGITGISVLGIEDRDTLNINDAHHYPMQSVYKFPQALYVLSQVDKHVLTLDQKVHISKEDLHPTWSPLRDKYPAGNIDMTVRELLTYSVGKSDNIACDILFRLVGGSANVKRYIHSLGVRDIAIVATEKEMSEKWAVQYTNWARPSAIVQLLDGFYNGKYLSKNSTALLMKIMTESENSADRIKGKLPEGTPVAHKTGTSDTNKEGITAAVNDAGIITLPNGKHVAITVFISNTTESSKTAEATIATITETVFNYYADKR